MSLKCHTRNIGRYNDIKNTFKVENQCNEHNRVYKEY